MKERNHSRIVKAGVSGLVIMGLVAGCVEYAGHTCWYDHINAKAVERTVEQKENVTPMEAREKEKEKKPEAVSKEETVYATLKADGQTDKIIVSNWLKNSAGAGKVSDVSELEEIVNTKGDETFTQNGENLDWETADADIYYQGVSHDQLPVGMTIQYELDGKEVQPADIVGKSGKLTIRIRYENRSLEYEDEDHPEGSIYTPFIMVTGMVLPVDKFTNVTIDHGQVVSEGDNDIVVAYGMPGLQENLALDDLDLGEGMDLDTDKLNDKMTDTVEITADVKDFSLGSTYTVATADFFRDLDITDSDQMDELDDKMYDIVDASSELVKGTKTLQGGLKTLDQNFDTYAKAIGTVNKGVKTLNKGAKELKKGTKTYTKGADQLLKGVNTYAKGAKTLGKGIKKYVDGVDTMVNGVNTLDKSTSGLPEQYRKFSEGVTGFVSAVGTLLSEANMQQMTDGTQSLQNGIAEVDAGLQAVQDGVSTINDTVNQLKQTEELDQCVSGLETMKTLYTQMAESAQTDAEKQQYQQMAAAVTGALQYIKGGEQVAAGLDAATNGKADGEDDQNGTADLALALSKLQKATDTTSDETNLYTGAGALAESAGTISGYAAQLRGSSADLLSADAQIGTGLTQISNAIGQLKTGGTQIAGNNQTLKEGADAIIKNTGTIQKNSKKLTKNSPVLRKATRTLAGGTKKLASGLAELVESTGAVSDGIAKLSDGSGTLHDGMSQFNDKAILQLQTTVADVGEGTRDLLDRVQVIQKASEEYRSYSGIADGMEGSVKFIMSTEEVK